MKKLRFFLADCQVLFREGVHLALSGEEKYEVIGEATTNEKALALIKQNLPDIAILNAGCGSLTGIEITHRIKQNLPSVAVVLVMDSYNDEQLFAALKSGASACFSKDIEPDELLTTIRKVVQGEYPITEGILQPVVASRIIKQFKVPSQSNKEADTLLAPLSPLESQILQLIVNGNRLEEIVRELNITEDTVKQRLYIILGKLVANDRNCL